MGLQGFYALLLVGDRDGIPKSDLKSGFEVARFRETRNTAGRLVFLDLLGERELIRGLPVINVMTGESDVL